MVWYQKKDSFLDNLDNGSRYFVILFYVKYREITWNCSVADIYSKKWEKKFCLSWIKHKNNWKSLSNNVYDLDLVKKEEIMWNIPSKIIFPQTSKTKCHLFIFLQEKISVFRYDCINLLCSRKCFKNSKK